MKKTAKSPVLERMLGSFGLALIVLIGWACDQKTKEPHTLAARARRGLAWLVIESVTGIGWAFDRIAPIDVKAETISTAFSTPERERHSSPSSVNSI